MTASRERLRLLRLVSLVLLAVAAGLICDALRENRVFFPKTRLPVLRTVPAS